MLEVHHHPICPFSRKLRILLNEKKIPFELFPQEFWHPKKSYLAINPSGSTPSIIIDGKKMFSGNFAISEYLEELGESPKFISGNPEQKAEIRRLTEWFDIKFYNEVTRYILFEKLVKNLSRIGSPNSQALLAAKKNVLYHMDYIAFLTKNNTYLTGETITLADFSAAAQISILDFAGDMPWAHNPKVKEWYSLIKSRPSFRSILHDKVVGITPPKFYSEIDF